MERTIHLLLTFKGRLFSNTAYSYPSSDGYPDLYKALTASTKNSLGEDLLSDGNLWQFNGRGGCPSSFVKEILEVESSHCNQLS